MLALGLLSLSETLLGLEGLGFGAEGRDPPRVRLGFRA